MEVYVHLERETFDAFILQMVTTELAVIAREQEQRDSTYRVNVSGEYPNTACLGRDKAF